MSVNISARTDYAVRAMLAIADHGGELVKTAALAETQDIPQTFLQGILVDLVHAGLLHSHRGMDGGYELARPATQISVGEVLRAIGGPLTTVRGLPVEHATYRGAATHLPRLWLAVATAIETVVDHISLADILARSSAPTGRRCQSMLPAVAQETSGTDNDETLVQRSSIFLL
jgi:Rrf2 family protein